MPEKYPPHENILNVFDEVKRIYSGFPTNIQEISSMLPEELSNISERILLDGYIWLTRNSRNPYLKEVGQEAGKSLLFNKVRHIVSKNLIRDTIIAFKEFNPEEDIMDIADKVMSEEISMHEPLVIFTTRHINLRHLMQSADEMGAVLIPIEFLQKAMNNPVVAIASLVFIGSQLRDFANSRIQLGEDSQELVIVRAYAMEAEFLRTILKDYPEISLSDRSKNILKEFPEGLSTLRLPKSIRYQSIIAQEKAALN